MYATMPGMIAGQGHCARSEGIHAGEHWPRGDRRHGRPDDRLQSLADGDVRGAREVTARAGTLFPHAARARLRAGKLYHGHDRWALLDRPRFARGLAESPWGKLLAQCARAECALRSRKESAAAAVTQTVHTVRLPAHAVRVPMLFSTRNAVEDAQIAGLARSGRSERAWHACCSS